MSLQETYEKYKDRADFYWVYIKEAHAIDSPRPSRKVKIAQHKTREDRVEAAGECVANIDLKIPLLIDDMRNTVAEAFHGWPDRLFILSPDGTIAYRGGRGPWGFKVDEMRSALDRLLREKAGQKQEKDAPGRRR